ncbi:DUF4145 domain-containing protein [Streptomyces sp. NPDC102270]|uniref:DUF4145 domain-containing protein n=1 Tax=Streptomyces sp. NPDC102270 TaxID=3366150 RepID=UPI0037FDA183
MASTICGWCGDRTHMAMVTEPEQLPGHLAYVYTAAFQCSNEACHRLSIATVSRSGAYGSPKRDMARDGELSWQPTHIPRQEFSDVPEQIANAAVEAHACLAIRACRGAVALARAVLEATAKDKGITSGPLVTKIDEMYERNLIRDITRELAHEIREGGNEIAHGDLADEPMPPEDAEAIVALMDEILEEVYQGPARMLALKKSRLEREQRNAEKKALAQKGA